MGGDIFAPKWTLTLLWMILGVCFLVSQKKIYIWNWRQVYSNWPANSQDNDWLDHFCPGMNFHGPGGHIFPKWALKPLWVNPICLEILKIYLSCKRNMELTFEVRSNWLINSWDMERAIWGKGARDPSEPPPRDSCPPTQMHTYVKILPKGSPLAIPSEKTRGTLIANGSTGQLLD